MYALSEHREKHVLGDQKRVNDIGDQIEVLGRLQCSKISNITHSSLAMLKCNVNINFSVKETSYASVKHFPGLMHFPEVYQTFELWQRLALARMTGN